MVGQSTSLVSIRGKKYKGELVQFIMRVPVLLIPVRDQNIGSDTFVRPSCVKTKFKHLLKNSRGLVILVLASECVTATAYFMKLRSVTTPVTSWIAINERSLPRTIIDSVTNTDKPHFLTTVLGRRLGLCV